MSTRIMPGTPADISPRIVNELRIRGANVVVAEPARIAGNITVKKRPSVVIAILLFLLCFVPGVIYLIAASKDAVTPFDIGLTVTPFGLTDAGGTTTITYSTGGDVEKAIYAVPA